MAREIHSREMAKNSRSLVLTFKVASFIRFTALLVAALR